MKKMDETYNLVRFLILSHHLAMRPPPSVVPQGDLFTELLDRWCCWALAGEGSQTLFGDFRGERTLRLLVWGEIFLGQSQQKHINLIKPM